MGCCGNRSVVTGISPQPTLPRPILLEYAGQLPLVVFGKVTGRRYHFPGPTARAVVDPRDLRFLEVIEGLSRVEPGVGPTATDQPPR